MTEADHLAMQNRIAAQALIEKILAEHEVRPRQSRLATLLGVSPIPASESSWHQGALGERMVARSLARLPEGWHTFHSVPIGPDDSDIDHLVVGPGGVFAIDAKHHRGKTIWVGGRTLTVNGQRESHIALAHAGAEGLSRVLRARLEHDYPVHCVIAVVAARQLTITETPGDVSVLASKGLLPWLLGQPVRMDAGAVTEVAAVLNDPATWRSTPAVDRGELSERFDELMTRVRRAEIIRSTWVIGAGVATFAACLAIISYVLRA